MVDLDRFNEMTKSVDKMKALAERGKGVRDDTLKKIRDRFGCSTRAEVKEKIEELKEALEETEMEYDERFKEFNEKWGDKLG